MNIRLIEAKDCNKFKEMLSKFYNSDATMTVISDEKIQQVFEESLEISPYFKTYIIEEIIQDKLEIVGYFILAFTWYTEFAGLIAVVDEIYLDEKTRGKSLGSQVFKWLEKEYSKKPEFKAIRLEYSRSNKDAVRLYNRLGFKDWDYGQMFLFLNQD